MRQPVIHSIPGTHIQWAYGLPAAALAGLIGAALMLIPLGAFGLGMLVAGILSVFFYRRRDRLANLTASLGARLGAAAGAFAFGIRVVLLAVVTTQEDIRKVVMEALQKFAARNPEPEAQQALEFFKSPQGFALIMATGLFLTFIAFVVFSGLGGVLGSVILKRRDRL